MRGIFFSSPLVHSVTQQDRRLERMTSPVHCKNAESGDSSHFSREKKTRNRLLQKRNVFGERRGTAATVEVEEAVNQVEKLDEHTRQMFAAAPAVHLRATNTAVTTYQHVWRQGSVVRTSVFSWPNFPDLRLIYG